MRGFLEKHLALLATGLVLVVLFSVGLTCIRTILVPSVLFLLLQGMLHPNLDLVR